MVKVILSYKDTSLNYMRPCLQKRKKKKNKDKGILSKDWTKEKSHENAFYQKLRSSQSRIRDISRSPVIKSKRTE